jgi:hypothetical protein
MNSSSDTEQVWCALNNSHIDGRTSASTCYSATETADACSDYNDVQSRRLLRLLGKRVVN